MTKIPVPSIFSWRLLSPDNSGILYAFISPYVFLIFIVVVVVDEFGSQLLVTRKSLRYFHGTKV
jgi:hypothetical protein